MAGHRSVARKGGKGGKRKIGRAARKASNWTRNDFFQRVKDASLGVYVAKKS